VVQRSDSAKRILLIDALADATAQGHEVIGLDVADSAACQNACWRIDMVVHLAADPCTAASR
jgi:nucleoside-diphosphate-sugar epimerase